MSNPNKSYSSQSVRLVNSNKHNLSTNLSSKASVDENVVKQAAMNATMFTNFSEPTHNNHAVKQPCPTHHRNLFETYPIKDFEKDQAIHRDFSVKSKFRSQSMNDNLDDFSSKLKKQRTKSSNPALSDISNCTNQTYSQQYNKQVGDNLKQSSSFFNQFNRGLQKFSPTIVKAAGLSHLIHSSDKKLPRHELTKVTNNILETISDPHVLKAIVNSKISKSQNHKSEGNNARNCARQDRDVENQTQLGCSHDQNALYVEDSDVNFLNSSFESACIDSDKPIIQKHVHSNNLEIPLTHSASSSPRKFESPIQLGALCSPFLELAVFQSTPDQFRPPSALSDWLPISVDSHCQFSPAQENPFSSNLSNYVNSTNLQHFEPDINLRSLSEQSFHSIEPFDVQLSLQPTAEGLIESNSVTTNHMPSYPSLQQNSMIENAIEIDSVVQKQDIPKKQHETIKTEFSSEIQNKRTEPEIQKIIKPEPELEKKIKKEKDCEPICISCNQIHCPNVPENELEKKRPKNWLKEKCQECNQVVHTYCFEICKGCGNNHYHPHCTTPECSD